MTTEKTDGLSMSLDQYIEQSDFYFSPYGDINLVNRPNPKPETPSRPIDENRDILDLSPDGDLADELSNIIKELDGAGTQANVQATLNGMIVQGMVKGLPKGTKPDVGLEQQGFKLPIQPGAENRFNPLKRNNNNNHKNTGDNLKAKLEMLRGKTKNANNFKRLPNAGPQTNPWAPGVHFQNHQQNHYPQQQQQVIRNAPAPPLIRLDMLNSLNLDPNALRNVLMKNQAGGLQEYLQTVSGNLGSKYDMQIQREIAEKQKKGLLQTDIGFTPISFDGPGIEEAECFAIGTATTLNSRFSAI